MTLKKIKTWFHNAWILITKFPEAYRHIKRTLTEFWGMLKMDYAAVRSTRSHVFYLLLPQDQTRAITSMLNTDVGLKEVLDRGFDEVRAWLDAREDSYDFQYILIRKLDTDITDKFMWGVEIGVDSETTMVLFKLQFSTNYTIVQCPLQPTPFERGGIKAMKTSEKN